MSRLRVHVMPELDRDGTEWASAAVRLLLPYRHPWMRQRIELSVGARLPGGRTDLVVLQRAGPPGFTPADAVSLLAAARQRGIRVIYDLDDDLLSEHPMPEVEANLARQRPLIRLLLTGADAVTVSTPGLRDRLRRLNPARFVWENALDDQMLLELASVRPADEQITIGYFGTHTHLADLLSIRESLAEGLSTLSPKAKLVLCGISTHPGTLIMFNELAHVTALAAYGDYKLFMTRMQYEARWDIGLAPLAPHQFNASKSDIKFLDYAAFGIPAIVSDCDSYATVQDQLTGFRVSGQEWGLALKRLAADPELRERVRHNARRYLLEQRVLSRRLPHLWDIIEQIM